MNTILRNIPFSPPDITEDEIAQVAEALRSGWITTGPKTKEFERRIADYCRTSKAVALNSATAALEIALRLIGIQPEDEVIVPAYTYTASASVTQHVGCKLVLIDTQADSVEIDYEQLASRITERTKVIIPVDLGGVVCDYDKLYAIVNNKKHLFRPTNELQRKIGRVIISADCAHAFGAQWHGKMAGEIADFSSFSFHAVKNLTTAEGGALTWNLPFGQEPVTTLQHYGADLPFIEGETWNEFLYRLSQLFSLHGQNKDALAKTKLGAWEYDIIGPWYKCNMTDIMAGIGLAQLDRYQGLLERRRDIIERYNQGLAALNIRTLNHYGSNHQSSGHLYIVRCLDLTVEQRNEVITKMAERGIACNVHYKPLPMMTAYKALGFDIAHYPNAYNLYKNEITLPLHTRLSNDDVDYIIDNFIDILNQYKQ
ncbi:MAG: DegT/DnrJ/EryC1/StrS family aminotransferase [Paludibacter sp.]|nr:DegT/DnrJ/EryC1/StrS family aminotransferase [Bacteroidales bacterium]MCM1069048.1 DegT/DnrJ/EryC1/StrS family aminotransferase [Prevotella sp.]MCM1353487.1 DegT/DnrJ/EryC1/StrS family aminotransferase [Bacteroides sp.]MCM1442648.1 DegT/DnrJ/EryC1/StrS family aminotransferase [Muribaculum sp.]MCM1481715.1 DegT/DnrJ/EryC1/StrS family aminotransferase [Paludibacter sp.]